MEEKYLKRQKIYKIIMLVVLTAFITFILTTIYIANRYDLTGDTGTNKVTSILTGTSEDDNLTKSLKYIEELVNKYYLNDIDEQKAIDGAISGYVSALGDEYTEYIPAKEMEEYTEQIMGNYVGIGIYMIKNKDKNTIDVLAPIKESPAEKAGLLPGDSIVKVDGVEYTGEDMTSAANAIKGKEGTKVKLEILRGQERKEFEIERKKITTNPVISEKMENDIGYLQISSFDEGTEATGGKTYSTIPRSAANTENKKELSIAGKAAVAALGEGVNLEGDDVVLENNTYAETDMYTLNSQKTIVEKATYTFKKSSSVTWTFTIKMYNYDFDQNDFADKTFGGTLAIENISCTAA